MASFETYGGQKIKIDFIKGLPRAPFRLGVDKYELVVMHDAANIAPAKNQSAYFHREWKKREAFVQFFVDKDEIIQNASIKYRAWGAGKWANDRGVHLELCRESSKADKLKGYKKWVKLAAWLLWRRKLGVIWGKTLVTHNWVSKNKGGTNHADPDAYLASFGVSINQMVADVKKEYNAYAGGKNKEPEKWDGKSFPGRSAFQIGKSHPAVTVLGQRLVAHGFGSYYKVGPGPTFTEVDKKACAAFQKAQGWSGSDADGYPGPETWKRLMATTKGEKKPDPKPDKLIRVKVGGKQVGAFADPANAVNVVKQNVKAGMTIEMK